MKRKKILYIFAKDRSKYLESKEDFPNNLLYGYDFLKKHEYNPGILTKRTRLLRYLDLPLNFLFNCYFGVGFNIFFILFNLKTIKEYDLVICVHDSVALPLLLFKKIGIFNGDICDISIGLAPFLTNSIFNIKEKLIRKLLGAAKYVFVFSKDEQTIIKDCLGIKCDLIRYGVDTNFFFPNKKKFLNRDKIIISSGDDSQRDYEALVRAWKIIQNKKNTNLNLLIVTSKIHKEKIDKEIISNKVNNVTVKLSVDYSLPEMRDLYSRMLLGVIPIKSTKRSVGQIAVLSMLAMGKNVITGVNSWQNQYCLNEQNGLYTYLTENYIDLSDKILCLLRKNQTKKQKNSFETIRNKYSSEIMVRDILKKIQTL